MPPPSKALARSAFAHGTARLLPVLLCAVVFVACASPTTRLRAFAEERGFERRTLVAGGFELTAFENGALREKARIRGRTRTRSEPSRDLSADTGQAALHVYLEGDGTPWLYKVIVMPDPTPRHPLMLGLMALDRTPAVYVGRPCYNGTSLEASCDDTLWTSARYSDAVVESMAEAIRALAERHGFEALRLFGHSGGGTLAMLLAARLPDTLDVVTVAGNLDPDAWTRHHGYTPLRESINPAEEPALGERVGQWHLVGGADRVVPPALVKPFIGTGTRTTGVIFPTFSHGCCWQRVWPGILRAVRRDQPGLLPGNVFRRAAPRSRTRAPLDSLPGRPAPRASVRGDR